MQEQRCRTSFARRAMLRLAIASTSKFRPRQLRAMRIRSRSFGEPYGNAGGRDPAKSCAPKAGLPNCLDFKTQIDNGVGVKLSRVANQRLKGLKTIRL
jgi:hypothetical protein